MKPYTQKQVENALKGAATIAEAAAKLGASPSTIRRAVKRYDIDTKRFLTKTPPKLCKQCSKTHFRERSDFCSSHCREQDRYPKRYPERVNRLTKECPQCGAEHTKRAKYCSDKCYNRARHQAIYTPRTNPTCLQCGKPSLKLSNYCSVVCYRKHNYVPVIVANKCLYCQKDFTISATNSTGRNVESSFCSEECSSKFLYWDRVNKGLCSMCGKNPPVEGMRVCGGCRRTKKKYKSKEPRPLKQQMLASMKRRAKLANFPCDISIDDIDIPEYCPVLGLKLERGEGTFQQNSPSVDRIVPELGYVKGNIAVISFRANSIKQDANIEEMEAVLEYMKAHKH